MAIENLTDEELLCRLLSLEDPDSAKGLLEEGLIELLWAADGAPTKGRLAAIGRFLRQLAQEEIPERPHQESAELAEALFLAYSQGGRDTAGALFLTEEGRYKIHSVDLVTVGNGARLHPRKLLRVARFFAAAEILLFRVRPTGDASPGDRDVDTLRRLRKAAAMVYPCQVRSLITAAPRILRSVDAVVDGPRSNRSPSPAASDAARQVGETPYPRWDAARFLTMDDWLVRDVLTPILLQEDPKQARQAALKLLTFYGGLSGLVLVPPDQLRCPKVRPDVSEPIAAALEVYRRMLRAPLPSVRAPDPPGPVCRSRRRPQGKLDPEVCVRQILAGIPPDCRGAIGGVLIGPDGQPSQRNRIETAENDPHALTKKLFRFVASYDHENLVAYRYDTSKEEADDWDAEWFRQIDEAAKWFDVEVPYRLVIGADGQWSSFGPSGRVTADPDDGP